MNKKITAVLLAVILVFTGISSPETAYTASKSAEGNINTENCEKTELNNNLTVEGTNSFGSLLEDKLSQEALEQQENKGCNIFSIEMTDKTANVSFETTMDATLVVAVYEEDGVKMLGSAKTDISAEGTQATVDFDLQEMPQYFYLRGFLVETETLQPLCISYESPMYTQGMQEFLAKGTDDFEADRVLNLDKDTENNFAVYSEETIRIEKNETENTVVKADDDSNVYVIENADENISSLKKDDIFAYEYGENEILIVKVADVTMNGTTATITGTDTSVEEVFDYVKIDGESGIEDAVIDPSICGEDVTYKGIVDYEDEDELQTYAWSGENMKSHALSYEFMNSKEKDFSGSVEIKFEGSVKYYISSEYQYVELKLDYSGGLKFSFKGKMFNKEIPLAYLKICIAPGVNLEFTPSILIELSAKIEWSGKLTGCIGFRVSSDEGIRNLTSSPKLKSEVKGEVTLFVGLSVKPKIEIISDLLAHATLEARVGGEVKATMKLYEKPSSSKLHGCTKCIDGDISGKAEVKFEVKLLNSEKLKYTYKKGKTVKLFDFYYSLTYDDFGFTACPHYWYQTTVNVIDENGKKIANATIKTPFSVNKTQPNGTVTDVRSLTDTDHITTGEDGKAVGYLAAGQYTLAVSADGYETSTRKITVVDDSKEVVVRLKKKAGGSVINPGGSAKVKEVKTSLYHTFALMDDGSLYMWGTNYSYDEDKYIYFDILEVISTPVKIMEHVSGIETYSYPGEANLHEYIAILCEDRSLYSMGMDRFQIATENSWTPVKVLDNVSTVSLGYGMLGAITENGDLYTWGGNDNVQQGNGATEINGFSLIKILSNVVNINMGEYGNYMAITKDGSLYKWGRNDYGQLGNGSTEYSPTPVKVLDNVVDATVDPCCSAITTDGSLYTWGTYYNSGGLLGNGTTDNSLVPVKILSNVVSLDWIYVGGTWNGYFYTGRAITKDGGLYTWCGDNRHGELGNGTTENSLVPVKILDNVVTVAGSCGAITKDGSLYKWGENAHGELGNGTTEDSLVPVKVLDNVTAVAGNSGAITKNGSLYKWGENYNGSLGTGTTEDSLVPVKVLDNVAFTDGVSAITKDGSLYAWGSNNNGRLGNGTTECSLVPVKVLDNVVSVYEDSWYPVYSVITKDNSLYMWGRNYHGQLGNGTTEDSFIPVKVNFPGTATVSTFASENSSFSTLSLPKLADTETASVTEGKNDISSESSESPSYVGNGIAVYSDLLPKEIYNFYIVKKKDAEDVLNPDNLLYIQQASTDETGKISIPYLSDDVESLLTAEHFIVGLMKIDISAASITVPNLKYDGTEQFVTPQVTYQGSILVEGKDYELTSGYSATNSGTHTVTISGIGIYTGTLPANYQVVCNHVYKDNRTLAKATTSKNGTLEQKCSICGNTKNVTIYAVKGAKLSATSYTYSGKAKKPSVALTDSKGKILKNNADYTASYASGRKNVGNYTVTITLKGRYSGTIKKTFTIKPKGTSISKVSAIKKGFTVKWKKKKTQTTGYEIQYSTSSKFKGAKTLKNIKSNIISKKVTKLKTKKKYYVRIRTYKTVKVNGKSTEIYSEWSKTKSVVTKK